MVLGTNKLFLQQEWNCRSRIMCAVVFLSLLLVLVLVLWTLHQSPILSQLWNIWHQISVLKNLVEIFSPTKRSYGLRKVVESEESKFSWTHSNRSRYPTNNRSAVINHSPESYESPLNEEPTLPSIEPPSTEGGLLKVPKVLNFAFWETSFEVPDHWPVSNRVPFDILRSPVVFSRQWDQSQQLRTWQSRIRARKQKAIR